MPIFSSGTEYETGTVPTLYPGQESFLGNLLGYLGGQFGQGVPSYEGSLTAPTGPFFGGLFNYGMGLMGGEPGTYPGGVPPWAGGQPAQTPWWQQGAVPGGAAGLQPVPQVAGPGTGPKGQEGPPGLGKAPLGVVPGKDPTKAPAPWEAWGAPGGAGFGLGKDPAKPGTKYDPLGSLGAPGGMFGPGGFGWLGLMGPAQDALGGFLAGDPAFEIDPAARQAVYDAQREVGLRGLGETFGNIEERYNAAGLGRSGGLTDALAGAGTDFELGQNALYSGLAYQDEQARRQAAEAAAGRQYGAVGLQSDLSSNFMNQLAGLGDIERGIGNEQIQDDYSKWLMEQPWANPWLSLINPALGGYQSPYVVQDPGQLGAITALLGGIGGEGGGFLGSILDLIFGEG